MTTASPNPADKAYARVTWRTIECHSARLTVTELARLHQVTPAEVRAAGADGNLEGLPVWLLSDALAEVESAGETFEGRRREDVELLLLCERCEEPSDDLDTDSGLCPTCVSYNSSRVVP